MAPPTTSHPAPETRPPSRPLRVVLAVLLALAALAGAPAAAQTATTAGDPAVGAPADGGGPQAPADDEGPPPTTATTGPSSSTSAPATTAVPPDDAPGSTTTAPAEPGRVGGLTLPEAPPEGFSADEWGTVRSAVRTAAACGEDPGAVCERVLGWTGNELVAESTQWVLDIPVRILLILLAAVVLNRLVRRAIANRLVRLTARSRHDLTADPANVQRRALRLATVSSTLASAATVAIFAIAGLVVLSELDINLGPMLAGAGIAGIAIGFGAQNLVRDVLAGLFVIIEDQYGVGDIIDVGKTSGVVEELTLRVTKLRDIEGTLWFVPNGIVAEVGNKTQLWSRAILDVEVAYGADHVKAGELIKDAADRLWREERPGARIIEEPELWGVERLGESGVTIRLAVKSAPADQWNVARILRGEIKQALDAAGIEIPFPHTTLYFGENKDGTAPPAHLRLAEDRRQAVEAQPEQPDTSGTETYRVSDPSHRKPDADDVDAPQAR